MANGEGQRKKCPECKSGSPLWMTTYGDMVTLLLTFFVAMISMSTISPGKFQQVAAGIRFAFGGKPPSVLMGGKSIKSQPLIESQRGIRQEMLKLMADPKYKGKITVEERKEGTLIILRNMTFFEPGRARLTKQAKELLAKIGVIIIEHTSNVLEIYGYTDDQPLPPTSLYPSNWHLGAARAASVARFFAEELRKRREVERLADIRAGRFNIDYYYNPDRFVPIGVGDKAIKKDIERVRLEIDTEKKLVEEKMKSGEITYDEAVKKLADLENEFIKRLQELRRKYKRIDILIKRETL